MKRIALSLFVVAFAVFLNATSPAIEAVLVDNAGVPAETKALWVFGGSVVPNPVSTAAGRNRLTGLSSAAGINALYVSVYQSTLSSSGRQMYQDADMAQLNAAAHGNGQEVWAAYGDVNWPTLGCTGSSFPIVRMQEVGGFNTANPSAAFDGVMLDVEPNPITEADFQALLSHYQCMRTNLPASIKLGAAISSFWDDMVTFPVGGPVKPAYQHIIDLNLDSVVVMGYRDTAGTATCPASNGLICLDKDEIAYASSIGKTNLVLVGIETLNVVPGQPESITFFEEGLAVMTSEAQLAANHFAAESGYGGMAIHNYNAEYLRGTPGFPIPSVIGTCSTSQNIDVESTGGTLSQGYPLLKAAFDAINLGTHTGTIVIEICGDTTEAAASSVLNASGSGSASYASISIRPVGGAARTITATTTAGLPMIDLNGADNVTIDGLNTNGNSLTIANTTVSASSNTSTVRFFADATSNTITNTSILGSASMAVGTNGGNILFGAGAITTGSDNNTISNCNIGPAGPNLQTKAIHFGGSSNIDPGTGNSGNVITNNNIFDYFGSAVASAGFYVASGTPSATFTNNRFYQTGQRVQTTGSTHAAIQIANGNGNNFLISGNTIGYSSSSATGTYEFVAGGTASKFYPIFLSALGSTAATSVQGNTIANISVTGNASGTGVGIGAPFAAINVAAGLVNVGNVAGNTIGSTSSAASISVNSSSASTSEVYGILYSPVTSPNISNNVIGGITVNNSAGNTVDFYGIRAQTNTTAANTIQNNTVGFAAAPIVNNATNSASNTYGIVSQVAGSTVTGNIVSNLSMAAGSGSVGAGATMIGIWIDNSSASADSTISQNTVRFLTNTDSGNNNSVQGILYNGDTIGTHVIARNLVHSITVPNAPIGTINGIYIQAGANTVQNNMVALGSDVMNGSAVAGINEVGGINNFFHNSVYIGGSGLAGNSSTFALTSSVTAATRVYRDNILFNARSNGTGTGKHYAIQVGGTAANPTGLTTNNNVLFANGVGGITGRFNSVDRLTLANWQSATGQDANSFSSNPQFIDPGNASPNLHISPSVSTVVEGGGANVGVADDFDGQTRSGLTPVDIGADAGNFTGIVVDNTAPVITYSSFGNTGSTANRVLSVTVSDNVAVASGGVSPRIYFRKNAGAYSSSQCSLTSGNAQSGTYDCTVNYALIGGVTAGDVVGYFVIAQDTAGNVASNPSGVVAANVNSLTTPPTPNTYTILQTFAGALSVGTGETITSLTNNGGLFQLMNAGTISGNTVVNITTDLLAETGTHSLNQQVEEGAGNWTITFQASGGPRLIEGGGGPMISLNGADRVTFSGLAFGPQGLTFRNLSNGSTFGFGADATSNSILNCVVEGRGLDVVTFGNGIVTGNDNNSVTDSTIRDLSSVTAVPSRLIAIVGVGAATNSNITIANNQLFNYSTHGILGSNASGLTIQGNTIFQTASRSTGLSGIQLMDISGTHAISQNVVRDQTTSGSFAGFSLFNNSGAVSLSGNRIYNIDGSAGGSGPLNAVEIFGSSPTSSVNLVNNMFSMVPATSTAHFVLGVLDSRSVGNLDLTHNTILVGGTTTGSDSWALVRATGSTTAVSLNDNIFFNNRTGGGADHFAVADQSAGGGSWSSNYNIFVGTGTTSANFFDFGTTAFPGTPVDFANWKAGPPARDGNSIASVAGAGPFNVANMFVSPSDLHLRVVGNNPAINAGTNSGVLTDFDGQMRPFNGAFDIGADEVQSVPTAADVSLSGRISNTNGQGIRNIRVTISGGNLAEPRTAWTGSFGYFRFDGLRTGQTYVVNVSGKRYVFAESSRVVTLVDELADVDFVGRTR